MRVQFISKSLYGFASVRVMIHTLRLVDYLPVQTHKPRNKFSATFFDTPMVKVKYSYLAMHKVLLDFSLTVKAATLIFISRCGSANSSANERKSGFIYNSIKSK